jgi:ABC-2 type transport system permease protein
MNQFVTLLKREFWEHRNTFVVLPLLTTGFIILMTVGMYIAADIVGVEVHLSYQSEESSQQLAIENGQADQVFDLMFSRLSSMPPYQREHMLYQVLHGVSIPLLVILWIVVFFYLIVALYDDRKDRSILFWKSMPVSDFATVASKLVAGLILVPAVYLVCIAGIQLALMIVSSLAAIGHDVSIWSVLWEPSRLVSRWFTLISFVFFQAIWSLPFYAWLLLVSAWANSVPLAWIIGVPVALSVVERIVSGNNLVSEWFADHVRPVAVADQELQISDLIPRLMDVDTLIGLIVGMVFVSVAIWLRGRGDEI